MTKLDELKAGLKEIGLSEEEIKKIESFFRYVSNRVIDNVKNKQEEK